MHATYISWVARVIDLGMFISGPFVYIGYRWTCALNETPNGRVSGMAVSISSSIHKHTMDFNLLIVYTAGQVQITAAFEQESRQLEITNVNMHFLQYSTMFME